MSDTPNPAAGPSAGPPNQSRPFYQYKVPQIGTVITFAPPELIKKWGGIRNEAVVARADTSVPTGADTPWARYQGSAPFRDLLHRVLATEGPSLAEYREAAQGRSEGFVVVVDLRSPNRQKPPVAQSDMIGAFKVKNGEILPGGYMPNPNYRTVSATGPTLLPDALHQRVMAALEALPPPASRGA